MKKWGLAALLLLVLSVALSGCGTVVADPNLTTVDDVTDSMEEAELASLAANAADLAALEPGTIHARALWMPEALPESCPDNYAAAVAEIPSLADTQPYKTLTLTHGFWSLGIARYRYETGAWEESAELTNTALNAIVRSRFTLIGPVQDLGGELCKDFRVSTWNWHSVLSRFITGTRSVDGTGTRKMVGDIYFAALDTEAPFSGYKVHCMRTATPSGQIAGEQTWSDKKLVYCRVLNVDGAKVLYEATLSNDSDQEIASATLKIFEDGSAVYVAELPDGRTLTLNYSGDGSGNGTLTRLDDGGNTVTIMTITWTKEGVATVRNAAAELIDNNLPFHIPALFFRS